MKILVFLLGILGVYLGISEYQLKSLRSELVDAYSKNTQLATQIASQNIEISKLSSSLEQISDKIEKTNIDLNQKLSETRLNIINLQDSLQESMKKFNYVATKRPGLVENKVNSASQQVLKCFESLSEGKKCNSEEN